MDASKTEAKVGMLAINIIHQTIKNYNPGKKYIMSQGKASTIQSIACFK